MLRVRQIDGHCRRLERHLTSSIYQSRKTRADRVASYAKMTQIASAKIKAGTVDGRRTIVQEDREIRHQMSRDAGHPPKHPPERRAERLWE
jgi:hypothetical protein